VCGVGLLCPLGRRHVKGEVRRAEGTRLEKPDCRVIFRSVNLKQILPHAAFPIPSQSNWYHSGVERGILARRGSGHGDGQARGPFISWPLPLFALKALFAVSCHPSDDEHERVPSLCVGMFLGPRHLDKSLVEVS
jgi:hypothetical protein